MDFACEARLDRIHGLFRVRQSADVSPQMPMPPAHSESKVLVITPQRTAHIPEAALDSVQNRAPAWGGTIPVQHHRKTPTPDPIHRHIWR
jgi:hypothetical protein